MKVEKEDATIFTSQIKSNLDPTFLKLAILRGGKALFLRHLIGFLINFTGGIVLARLLGPRILGLYFISYTLLLIFRGIIDFGIKTHFIRFPSNPSLTELRTAFTLQQLLGLISSLVIVIVISPFLVYWYGHQELLLLICSAGIGAYFYSWQSIPLSLMERKLRYSGVGVIEVADIFVFNLVAIIGTVVEAGIWGLAIGNVLRGFLPALLSLFITEFRPGLTVDKKAIVSLSRSVYPIFGSDFIVWVIMLAPPVLVGSIAGVKALGIAQMTYNLLGNTMVISTIFQRISLTALSRLQEDHEQFNRFVNKALHLLSLIYIPITMGIASFSPCWIPLVYGDKWKGMEEVMLIAAMPIAGSALFSILLSALLAKGQAPLVFKQNILHAIIYWLMMAILATHLSALSVPVAHLIAMSSSIIFIYGYHKYCGKLDYQTIGLLYLIGVGLMAISWYAAIIGKITISFIVWGAFLLGSVTLSSMGRKTISIAFNINKRR